MVFPDEEVSGAERLVVEDDGARLDRAVFGNSGVGLNLSKGQLEGQIMTPEARCYR